MRWIVVSVLALLAGCAQVPGGYRAEGVPIYSNAVFEPARLAGTWVQVAEFAPSGAAPCTARGMEVAPGGSAVQAELCLGGAVRTYAGPVEVTGPGRLRLASADPRGIGAEWWVLWVDTDYRTLVVGTPSGSFGMILNRTADLPPDRLAAAQDVLAWNGYDLSLLRRVGMR